MGWIRVEDSIFDHPAFNDDNERMTWLWMIRRAAYAKHTVRYRNRPVTLLAGEFAMTVRDLAAHREWSKSKVERFLSRLKTGTGDGPMIETRTETGFMIVKICNYDNFQNTDGSSETATETKLRQQPRRSRDSRETQREQINNSSVSIDTKSRARVTPKFDDQSNETVSRETSQITDEWKSFCGSDAMAPGDMIGIANAVQRHGVRKILDVIDRARASPFLRGEQGNWTGMPLKWLWDDQRIAEILRGEHDGKPSNSNSGNTSVGYMDFLRPDPVSETDGSDPGAESVSHLRVVEG